MHSLNMFSFNFGRETLLEVAEDYYSWHTKYLSIF